MSPEPVRYVHPESRRSRGLVSLVAPSLSGMSDRKPSPRYTVGACRRCGAHELHVSRDMSRFEMLVSALSPLRPLRCPACGLRGFMRASLADPRPEPAGPTQVVPRPRRRGSKMKAHARRRRVRELMFVVAALGAAAAMGYSVAQH